MLLKRIQQESLDARKRKDSARAQLLVTLYSEAARVGKDAGNRDSTDEEVLRTVRKFLKGVEEFLAVTTDAARRAQLLVEKETLEGYLPAMVSEEVLRAELSAMVLELPERSPKAMGLLMTKLRTRYGASLDGAMASKLVREAVSV